MTQTSPGTERGDRQDKNTQGHPKTQPKTQKRVLGHERTTRLRRPAPALSGGGSAGQKHAETPQTNPRDSENARTKRQGNLDLGTQKNAKLCSGGAQISCPRLRLEICLRYVGPPVQLSLIARGTQPYPCAKKRSPLFRESSRCAAPIHIRRYRRLGWRF